MRPHEEGETRLLGDSNETQQGYGTDVTINVPTAPVTPTTTNEWVELTASLKPFIATILLTHGLAPKNFNEWVMPSLMNLSTSTGMLLKINDMLERRSLSHLSGDITRNLNRFSYQTIMYGILLMQMSAMNAALETASFTNVLGVFAVAGFFIFSGMKFPGVTYSHKQNFFIELGLNVSSWGFLIKNIIEGVHAKKTSDQEAWHVAFNLILASMFFILATGYHMVKAYSAWNTEKVRPSTGLFHDATKVSALQLMMETSGYQGKLHLTK